MTYPGTKSFDNFAIFLKDQTDAVLALQSLSSLLYPQKLLRNCQGNPIPAVLLETFLLCRECTCKVSGRAGVGRDSSHVEGRLS